jgi:hypothetical protein
MCKDEEKVKGSKEIENDSLFDFERKESAR